MNMYQNTVLGGFRSSLFEFVQESISEKVMESIFITYSSVWTQDSVGYIISAECYFFGIYLEI